MIYDPEDVRMALREDLVLMYSDGDGNWLPMHEIRKASNYPDDFTRPSW